LDVWLYIYKEDIPVVPLYLAKPRKVINRNGQLLLEGNCIKCKQDEKVETIMCRFRTLGCQICTGAIPSTADTLEKVINEVAGNKQSERANRVVDMESGDSSMERKKVDGYF
jgi:sulfate adenylyltransferase subunit 2